jgi:uncharacterized protein YajQ (UPF0234 family)
MCHASRHRVEHALKKLNDRFDFKTSDLSDVLRACLATLS